VAHVLSVLSDGVVSWEWRCWDEFKLSDNASLSRAFSVSGEGCRRGRENYATKSAFTNCERAGEGTFVLTEEVDGWFEAARERKGSSVNKFCCS